MSNPSASTAQWINRRSTSQSAHCTLTSMTTMIRPRKKRRRYIIVPYVGTKVRQRLRWRSTNTTIIRKITTYRNNVIFVVRHLTRRWSSPSTNIDFILVLLSVRYVAKHYTTSKPWLSINQMSITAATWISNAKFVERHIQTKDHCMTTIDTSTSIKMNECIIINLKIGWYFIY